MPRLDKRTVIVLASLGALLAAALVALDKLPVSEEAKSTARRMLVTGFGIAAAVALGAVALLSLPWWVAAVAAGVVLVLTGAYNLAASLTGLPEIQAAAREGDPDNNRPGDPCDVGPYWWNGVFYACNNR